MLCPNCTNENQDPLSCTQCGGTFCDRCQPHWCTAGEICSGCSEANTISALRDDAWTANMRRWFSKKAEPVVEPKLSPPLPWSVMEDSRGDIWICAGVHNMVAKFRSWPEAEYACRAANQHYQLSALMVLIYERIRAGDAWFDGSEEDCKIWQRLKDLLK